tara:strand:+ start:143 stop:535 length:393 start_codon:yes stop_codon:yes gene_type:complete
MADLLPEYGQKAIDQLREKVYYLKIQIRVLTLLLILVLGYLGINEYNSSPKEYSYSGSNCGLRTVYINENSIRLSGDFRRNNLNSYYILNSLSINEAKSRFNEISDCSDAVQLIKSLEGSGIIPLLVIQD